MPLVDSLTQLPTRVYFEDRLAAAATKCDANAGRLALLFIDLDGFKPVNDTYGHSIGDLVLEQVGQRLKAMSRGKDVVARVGGDEFLLLLTNVQTEETVAQVASRLIQGLSHPYAVEGREVMISCSVGIAMYPDGCSHAKLIARADAAMYASKRAGGSNHCFYSTAMDADAEAQFTLLSDLRKAVAAKEFELFYQPKIDSKSGKVTAVEALLRWKHPTRGVLLPSVFIPIAERFGLIGQLGNWVIEDACRQSRAWRDKGLRMRVAINLSAHQMRQDDIVERITGALEQYKIHPSLLTCEITESAAMEDTKTTQATFRRLGELGTHLSIDDFGTGYSSLAYLRKLPAEELKIDRSFIMDLEHSADARAVVDAVIKLAHALGLKVVAEGVENQRQQQILVQHGLRRAAGLPLRQADVRPGAAALGDQRPPGNRRLQAVAVRRNEAGRARLRLAGGPRGARGAATSSPERAARRRKCPVHRNALSTAARAPYSAITATQEAASPPGAHHVRQHPHRRPDLQPSGRRLGRDRVGDVRHPPAAKAATPVVVLPRVIVTAQRLGRHEIVTMPQVTITAQRAEPDDVVTMPMVMVTGRREAVTVAVETRASETPRVQ